MTAYISGDGLYRYLLVRAISDAPKVLGVVMVNPSTADATNDDPTIRKLRGFATRMGYGRIVVANKFAYRATDVRQLKTVADPVGPDNRVYLGQMMEQADDVLVAWGPLSKLPRQLRNEWRKVVRVSEIHRKPLQCLRVAQDGHPCHPLMLPYSLTLEPWRAP